MVNELLANIKDVTRSPKVTIAHNPHLKTTVAISFTDTYLLFSYAICNESDQWVKKVGVAKVLGRLKGKQHIRVETMVGDYIKKGFLDFFRSRTSWTHHNYDKEDTLKRWFYDYTPLNTIEEI